MSLDKTFAITISVNGREEETVHMVTEDGNAPSTQAIKALIAPYVKTVWHESGEFEVLDVENVQESVDRMLSFSKDN